MRHGEIRMPGGTEASKGKSRACGESRKLGVEGGADRQFATPHLRGTLFLTNETDLREPVGRCGRRERALAGAGSLE
jgi:hypothetical protein